MKFALGSEIDIDHCIALKHEFLRCEDAFNEFANFGAGMIKATIVEKESATLAAGYDSRWLAFKTYNAYARFVHHFYEFLLGAMMRERMDTRKIRWEDSDPWIQANAQRVLTGRRTAVTSGIAPSWENSIDAFPESVPPEFAREFRGIRNKANGHVTYQRTSESLTSFFEKYHQFLYMTYWNCLGFWGENNNEAFPDLKEVTDFSLLISKQPTSVSPPREQGRVSQVRNVSCMRDIWRLR